MSILFCRIECAYYYSIVVRGKNHPLSLALNEAWNYLVEKELKGIKES